MEKSVTAELTPELAKTQTGTQANEGKTQTEDTATELARLRQEKIDADKRLAEKDKTINDLSTEKATLETRLNMTQATESVVETEGKTPAPTGQDARGYVRPEDIPEIIERTSFINKIKEENKDMMDLGLELAVGARADQLMRQGKSFKESVATAVKEQREKFDKIKTPAKATETAPAAGVRGEDGAPASIDPKPKVEESLDDEGAARQKLRIKRGL